MLKRSLVIISVAIFLIVSCSSLRFHPAKQKVADPRTKGEESFDPLDFEEDKEIVTQREYQRTETQGEEEKSQFYPEYESPEKAKYEYKTVYRVQVYASKIPSQAEAFADSVEAIFGSEKIYVEYQVPYYRVRVDECASFDEAEELLSRLKKIGFKQAWVVKVRVKIEGEEE